MGDWKVPSNLKYSESDEWFAQDGETVTVGITDYAQDQLNDIVYVEFREAGESIAAGDSFGEVESVKAASDIYAPVTGTVVAINETLEDAPERVNQDPYGDGWFFKIDPTDAAELDNLLSADAYQDHCDSEAGAES